MRAQQPTSVRQNNDIKVPSSDSVFAADPVARAEMEQLKAQVATLQEQLQTAKVEKNEWKVKAKSLASNFLGTLKDLKVSLYNVKRDQKEGFKDIRNEFDDRLRHLASQVVMTQSSQEFEEAPEMGSMASSYHGAP